MEKEIQRQRRSATSFLTAAWMLFGEPLDELVKSEKFRIRHIAEVSSGEKRLVRVVFDRTEAECRPGGTLSDGYLLCDPSNNWSLVEYAATWHNIDGAPFMRKHTSVEIGDVLEGVPIVRSKRQSDTWIDRPDNTDTSVMNLKILGTDIADEEFRLSGYGLPEPSFERPWYGAWFIYFIAAAGCVGIAFAIERRRQSERGPMGSRGGQ